MPDYVRETIEVNDEFQINSYTDSDQFNPSVTALTDGGFVVTWTSNGQDGSLTGVYGQRYTSSGVKTGGEFQINTYTAEGQFDSSVTALTDGGFVVTWTSYEQDGSDGGVYGQSYTSSGVKAGGEFQINSYTVSHQYASSVTALAGGGFVVTWSSNGQDGNGYGVYGQRYTSSGTKVGGEFQINSYTDSDQGEPSVTALADGGFVVTWTSEDQDGDSGGVYGQRYTSSGAKAGGEFQINSYTDSFQFTPSVTVLTDGGFVVTWTSNGQDGSSYGVYGQRYTSSGVKAGGEFQINSYTDSYQEGSSVTALADGGFVVIWASDSQDGNWYGIYGQRYTSSGVKAGDEFRINSYTDSFQFTPSVTALTSGGFVVTWTSYDQDGSDGGVYGQRYSADGTPYTITFSRLDGTTGNDPDLAGTAGQDLIYGLAGNDSIVGLAGADRLYGNVGADTLIGNQGDDTLHGGRGSDSLRGSRGRDTLYGESGDDYLSGGVDSDLLYGSAGNDTLSAGKGADLLFGGDGNDLLYGRRGRDKLYGDSGDDTLYGNQDSDTLYGGKGNDTLYGDQGNDGLHGDEDNDWLSGDEGNDWLHGDEGNDTLYGDEGNDTLYGDEGNDFLFGGKGNEWLVGGTGDDYLQGGDSNDNLFGGEGNDTLYGGRNSDTLWGDEGNDELSGGRGHDFLSGELGTDTLRGGAGNDDFCFDTELGDTNIDTIMDFTSGQDHILLDYYIFTGLEDGTLSDSSFHSSADGMATETSHRILYNTTTGALFFDADGSGTGAAVQFALLKDAPGLTASDFIVFS